MTNGISKHIRPTTSASVKIFDCEHLGLGADLLAAAARAAKYSPRYAQNGLFLTVAFTEAELRATIHIDPSYISKPTNSRIPAKIGCFTVLCEGQDLA